MMDGVLNKNHWHMVCAVWFSLNISGSYWLILWQEQPLNINQSMFSLLSSPHTVTLSFTTAMRFQQRHTGSRGRMRWRQHVCPKRIKQSCSVQVTSRISVRCVVVKSERVSSGWLFFSDKIHRSALITAACSGKTKNIMWLSVLQLFKSFRLYLFILRFAQRWWRK